MLHIEGAPAINAEAKYSIRIEKSFGLGVIQHGLSKPELRVLVDQWFKNEHSRGLFIMMEDTNG